MPEDSDGRTDPRLMEGGSSATLDTGRYEVPETPVELAASPSTVGPPRERYDQWVSVAAPDAAPKILLGTVEGIVHYEVIHGKDQILAPAPLGLSFEDGPDLVDGFRFDRTVTTDTETTFTPQWGAEREIRNRYRQLRVTFVDGSRRVQVIARASSDGVAFRYRVPDQPGLDSVALAAELTGIRFPSTGTAWWIPGDFDSYEYLYRESTLAEVERAHTPFTVGLDDPQRYLSVHEAGLTDYAAATLQPATTPRSFRTLLTPTPGAPPVTGETPLETPWRSISLGQTPGDLVESRHVLTLNDPPKREFGWVEPGTYLGVWWAMHIGKWTWAPGPRLGATTEHVKEYVDFAAEHSVPYVLVEGWNRGWENEDWKDMDYTSSNDRYDLQAVVEYARDRDVGLIGHVETGGDVRNFEDQLEETFDLFADLGIPAVKTGYVGEIDGHAHHDQRMVEHHRRVLETAADRGLMVDVHEGIKPTGLRRTYPNLMSTECVRGQEFEAWSGGNTPHHLLTIPFTRMLGGPVDYTPGIFELDLPDSDERPTGEVTPDVEYRVHTTRGFQLALYVIYLSGVQMLADLPEHYADEPEFSFLEGVPATWDETRVLGAAIGDHVVLARRRAEEWYLGGATARPRTFEVPLKFLPDGPHEATVFADGPDADYEANPTDVSIETVRVTPDDTLAVGAERGGGFAARIVRYSSTGGTGDSDRNGKP